MSLFGLRFRGGVLRETVYFGLFWGQICVFLWERAANCAAFNKAMLFVFNNFSASSQLISNNPFVFNYFLASFQLPLCAFNDILASIVYFLFVFQFPVCASANRFPPSPAPRRPLRLAYDNVSTS
jgi:hypothetical protein